MSSNFSLSFSTFKNTFYKALGANDADYATGSISKADFANYVLNDMQNEIADAVQKRDAAQLDLPGFGKLPIGDDYDDASDAVKELQSRQAIFAKMLTVEGTGSGAKSMFDILAGSDGKLSANELQALDANSDSKLTNSDFKTKFGTGANAVSDDVIATFDDKLKSADREAVVDLDPDNIEDDNDSGFSLTKLLPKLLTGQLGIGDLLPMLLGDQDSDDPLMQLLPALLGGGNGGASSNPIALLLPLLLGKDDSSSSSSDDSLTKLLPILLLTMTQQQPAAAPTPAPISYNPWSTGGTNYGTGSFGTNSYLQGLPGF